jgi:hypothetical protein
MADLGCLVTLICNGAARSTLSMVSTSASYSAVLFSALPRNLSAFMWLARGVRRIVIGIHVGSQLLRGVQGQVSFEVAQAVNFGEQRWPQQHLPIGAGVDLMLHDVRGTRGPRQCDTRPSHRPSL